MSELALDFEAAGSGVILRMAAYRDIAKHRMVCWSGHSTGLFPSVRTADCKNRYPAIGLSLEAISEGKRGLVLLFGVVRLNYNPGQGDLFLGEDGLLTNDPGSILGCECQGCAFGGEDEFVIISPCHTCYSEMFFPV